ncbi:MAG: lycopene beta-cyclase CrtY [Hyphomicrobiaceae bacterium]
MSAIDRPLPPAECEPATTHDVILAGGGLANMLIALALHAARPALRLLVLERSTKHGADHTWSFHATDITAKQHAFLAPLIVASWPRQEVRFPKHSRLIETGYNSITAERLHEVTRAQLGAAIRLGVEVAELTTSSANLTTGERFTAPLVVDGRGLQPSHLLALGYQKFVGLVVETAAPHGLKHPIIMDATVPQHDGYRFVYSLPFSGTRLLIEDTYYSDTPALDQALLTGRIESYAATRGWRIGQVVRREAGVLPIALAGRIEEHWREISVGVPRSGLRAWLFHATTGYSLPYAMRLAEAVAVAPDLNSRAITQLVERQSRENWRKQSLFRLLNRSMFLAADPSQRVRILQQFYHLPRRTIERFYAGSLNGADIMRLIANMASNPPIGISRALSSISEARAWRFAKQHAGDGTNLG